METKNNHERTTDKLDSRDFGHQYKGKNSNIWNINLNLINPNAIGTHA